MDRPDTRHGHKPADLHVVTRQRQDLSVEIGDLLLDGLANTAGLGPITPRDNGQLAAHSIIDDRRALASLYHFHSGLNRRF